MNKLEQSEKLIRSTVNNLFLDFTPTVSFHVEPDETQISIAIFPKGAESTKPLATTNVNYKKSTNRGARSTLAIISHFSEFSIHHNSPRNRQKEVINLIRLTNSLTDLEKIFKDWAKLALKQK